MSEASGPENPLAAMWRLLGGDADPADQSRHADTMRLVGELLATPADDPAAIARFMARTMERISHRFDDLPPAERGKALAGYLASLRTAPVAPTAPDAVPDTDDSSLDELLELHERLLPELAPGSREEDIVRNGRRLIRLARIQRAPAAGDAAARLRWMREAAPLLKEATESLPEAFKRLGTGQGDMEAQVAFAHMMSPFETVARIQEWIREIRGRLASLSPEAAEFTEARTALAVMLFLLATVTSDEVSFREGREIARDLAATAWPLSAILLSGWVRAQSQRQRLATLAARVPDTAGQPANPLTRLASDRAATSLAAGDARGALETLEDGRSQLFSPAVNTRAELEALGDADADLRSRLLSVLDEMVAMQRAGALAGRLATDEEGQHVLELMSEGTRLVAELRRRPGLGRFLVPVPLGLADLRPAAADGPVITVNVNPRRCDALALCPDGLRTVPLPGLAAGELAEQADSFRDAVEILRGHPGGPLTASARSIFDGVLGWLWDVLAEPVLDALGLGGPPAPGAPWPRIWWSPTGMLNSFPLHAAGHHGRPGASVLDRAASSYTPTLRALLLARARARRAREQREGRHAAQRRGVLAVAVPGAAGYAPLPRTVAEAAAAAGQGGRTLAGTDASSTAVLSALPGTSVAHFACHAGSDPENPAASHLLLHDGPLPLREIAALRLDGAELAYLSACATNRGGTALADEAIHLASAFQLAGYTQSVGTLWEIGDTFAAAAAAEFHRVLAPAMAGPAPLPAALALHATVRELRHSHPRESWAWAALVHAGA